MSKNNQSNNQQQRPNTTKKAAAETSDNAAKSQATPTTKATTKADSPQKSPPDKQTAAAEKKPQNTTKTPTKPKSDAAATNKTASKTTAKADNTSDKSDSKANAPQQPPAKPNNTVNNAANKPTKTDKPKADKTDNSKAEAAAATATNEQDKLIQSDAKPDGNQNATPQAAEADTLRRPPLQQPQPAKKNGLWVGLALLAGFVGTVLGAYSFNELRQLKSNMSNDTLTSQMGELDSKVTTLTQSNSGVEQQLTGLTEQQQKFTSAEQSLNSRIAAVEQMQKGLTKAVKADIDQALADKMATIDGLLTKVKNIELGQKGLSKNLNQVAAAGEVATTSGLSKQEIGYLLRMASYKLQSEGDVAGAIGLLKMAEQKLLAANDSSLDALLASVRESLIRLDGVEPVDTDKLVAALKNVAGEIPQLVVKATPQTATQEVGQDSTAADMWSKTKAVLASGIKYTPADPSKIDISAETVLIEKRLMQADIKTAEFAVLSHNKVLLAESIRSLTTSLNSYFADDSTAKSIKSQLAAISQSELESALPSLSGLIEQYQATQPQ